MIGQCLSRLYVAQILGVAKFNFVCQMGLFLLFFVVTEMLNFWLFISTSETAATVSSTTESTFMQKIIKGHKERKQKRKLEI